ncbi:family 47 glycosyl hydrolase [Stachybotrys elegans]|uniref:alpha-1,2-Mannosidase n=1 Tax=Stachybotrys elegans TaxID=80388 RepID=A0A8K0SUI6_9HYPO|nr:family 47 glycosyl hydrolase [Stachybotrys elegans]
MRVVARQTKRYLAPGALFFVILTLLYAPASLFWDNRESVELERFMNTNTNPASVLTTVPSSFDWGQVALTYLPPDHVNPLPRGRPKSLPRVQHSFGRESSAEAEIRRTRRNEVRSVFANDWQSYRQYAWKKDALTPVSAGSRDQFSGWAATLVDSLDTLWIMGFKDEFEEAVAAVAEIDFGSSTTPRVNIFETTIRYLGGLLAAYDLSQRKVLLDKAVELGNLIYGGFNTPSRMPVDFIDFAAAKEGQGLNIEEWVVSASPGTLSMELTRLSQLTGDPKYYDVASRLMREFHAQQSQTLLPGLWPIWVSMKNLDLHGRREFTLGGSADSLYEYLPKMYALLGGLDPMYENMTTNFIEAAMDYLFFRPMLPNGEDILISGNVNVNTDGQAFFDPESEHLTCFIGGTVALAGRLLGKRDYVEVGAKLADGCAYAYQAFESGIMPERYNMVPCEPTQDGTCPWDEEMWLRAKEQRREWKPHLPKGFTTAKDPRHLLRPEAIESLFVLYRITGDATYQELAWDMFQAVTRASRTKHGHASVRDVTQVFEEETRDSNLEDFMETFWLAETLKYYYLIFSPPDLISLDEWVLNTEAHPFRRPK